MCSLLIICMGTYIIGEGENSSRLLQLDDCTCLGHTQTFECVVFGPGITLWQGTAFRCPTSVIRLRHSRYNDSGAIGGCNDGAIVASSVGVLENLYTSKLNVTVGQEMINGTIECVHQDIYSNNTMVDTRTLRITKGKLRI